MMTKEEIEFTLLFAFPVPTIFGLIFSSLTTFVILFMIFGFISARFIINRRDKKEQLMITRHNDDIILMLTDDDYLKFNISDIKDDSNKVFERIKEVVTNRSKELQRLVDKVVIYNNQDKSKEAELLSIINTAK
jgi:hypothetical protein